jgi:hypothetical protein
MADQKLRVDIIGDASKLNRALNTASGKLKSFGTRVSGVGKRLAVGLTLPIGIAGAAAIKMASDFEESMNKVDVAFGSASSEVKDFAKTTLDQFGIAEGTALDMAALFGDMSTSMGLSVDSAADLSTSLVGLAGDLASFKNMNIQEVTTALNGVFTGETESLKRLGIVMTQVNLEQFAMEQGITKTMKQMSQAEKVQLRYNFVMSKTANAQGDFSRTSGGAANQMRKFQETIKELGALFGAVILPAFTSLVKKANAVLKKFRDLDDGTKKTIIIIAGIAAAIAPTLIVIGAMSSGIGALASGLAIATPILIKVASAFKTLTVAMLANPVGIIASAVALLTAGMIELLHRINPAVSRIQTFFNVIKSLGDPVKFAALQAESLAISLKEKSDAAAAAAKAQADLKKTLERAVTPTKKLKTETDNLANSLKKVRSIASGGDTGEAGLTSADGVKPITIDFEINAPNIDEINSGLKNTLQRLQQTTNQVAEEIEFDFANMAIGISDALGNALVTGENVFAAIGSVILNTIGTLLQQMGTAAVLASKLSLTFAVPIVGAAAGLAAIGLGAAMKAFAGQIQNVKKFANGGIVSAPTLGLMGEYTGARSNPEVIAPLDKLKGMLGQQGGQNINVGGEFRIQGQDLVVALQRAEKNRSRLL